MKKELQINKLFFTIFLCTFFVLPFTTNASETSGTIDATAKYAWSDNLGWINFAPTKGGLQISDTAITGSAWSNNNGWINFNPAKGGVLNDDRGNLSGFAWGEQTGWIDFSGVSINSEGKFTGTATGAVIGTLTFDCSKCDVQTDWRPQSSRTQESSISGSVRFADNSTTVPNSQNILQLDNIPPIMADFFQSEDEDPSTGLSDFLESAIKNRDSDRSESARVSKDRSRTSTIIENIKENIKEIYKIPMEIAVGLGSLIKNTFNQTVSLINNIFYGVIDYIKAFFGR